MKQIIIVEDDKALNNGIAMALKREDLSFRQCYKLSEFPTDMQADLVLLDVNLPDGNGFDFLKKLRQTSNVPVIMITANDLETDEVMGLELGADDYVTKPFSLMVLRARIDKILKKGSVPAANHYQDEKFFFDFDQMKFLVHGEAVELSKTEQRLLRLLTQNAGKTLTRDYLVDRIWTDGAEFVEENALSVTIARLRRKLDANDHVQTIYGIGYSWRIKE